LGVLHVLPTAGCCHQQLLLRWVLLPSLLWQPLLLLLLQLLVQVKGQEQALRAWPLVTLLLLLLLTLTL
jgi:hypothetical protein